MFWKKKKVPTDFELMEEKLLKARQEAKIGSPEYDKINEEIEKLYALHGKRKELRRRVDPAIKRTLVSGSIMGCLMGANMLFELKGNTYTGQQRGNVTNIFNTAFRTLFGMKG